jgi:hypothetical protein
LVRRDERITFGVSWMIPRSQVSSAIGLMNRYQHSE